MAPGGGGEPARPLGSPLRARGRGGRGRRGALARLTRALALLVLALAGAGPVAAQAGPLRLEADSVRVVFWPGDEPIARRTLAAALRPAPLPGLPDRFRRLHGTILLAPDEAHFDSLTRGAPGWSAGVAIPGLRRIILPAYRSRRTPLGDPIQALRHEMAHLALAAYLPGEIPRWFNEGYATWASGGWGDEAAWQIRLALLRREGPRLDSLTLSWPRRAEHAHLAYLLSASAVHHLATRGGPDAFAALLAAWRREGSLDAALRSTYLMTVEQFQDEWRRAVRRRYGWLLALSQIGAFWLAATGLVLLLGVLRRRSNRDRMAAMRAEERMLPPPRPDGVDVEYPLE